MPKRSSSASVRKLVPRKKPMAPRRKMTNVMAVGNKNTVYAFKRTAVQNYVVNENYGFSGTAPAGFGMGIQFSLASMGTYTASTGITNAAVPNYGEFVALFDHWRIKYIDVKLIFSNNASTLSSNATGLPVFYICEDTDDGQYPANQGELLQRPETAIMQMGAPYGTFTKRIKPKAAVGMVANGAGEFGGWLDCNQAITNNYGMKIWYDNQGISGVANIGQLSIYASYVFEFKGVR